MDMDTMKMAEHLKTHSTVELPSGSTPEERASIIEALRKMGLKVHCRRDKLYGKWLVVKHNKPGEWIRPCW